MLAMLLIENLSIGFKSGFRLYLDKLELSRGQVALLKGPNGAGKSTLARFIAGLLDESQAEISVRRFAVPGAVCLACRAPGLALLGNTPAEHLEACRLLAPQTATDLLKNVRCELRKHNVLHRPFSELPESTQAQLALLVFLIAPAGVLIIDELLDIVPRESLPQFTSYIAELTGCSFPPVVIVITHSKAVSSLLSNELSERGKRVLEIHLFPP